MPITTEATQNDITVSEVALQHIHELREQSGLDDEYAIRVSVTGGGCSGLTYNLDFDNEEQFGDQVFEDKGLKILVNLKSYLYLAGTILDFSGGLDGKGFHEPQRGPNLRLRRKLRGLSVSKRRPASSRKGVSEATLHVLRLAQDQAFRAKHMAWRAEQSFTFHLILH